MSRAPSPGPTGAVVYPASPALVLGPGALASPVDVATPVCQSVAELGVREEVGYARRIVEEGTSAHRQLAAVRETGELTAVVDRLIRETMEGVG